MSYSDFSIREIQEIFSLEITEELGIFANVPESEITDYLQRDIHYQVDEKNKNIIFLLKLSIGFPRVT